jgi:hypothetical protein
LVTDSPQRDGLYLKSENPTEIPSSHAYRFSFDLP